MKHIWWPLTAAKWVGLKIRTLAAQCTAARLRAKLGASTTKKIGAYAAHVPGSRSTSH